MVPALKVSFSPLDVKAARALLFQGEARVPPTSQAGMTSCAFLGILALVGGNENRQAKVFHQLVEKACCTRDFFEVIFVNSGYKALPRVNY